jgi:hypothetical protein
MRIRNPLCGHSGSESGSTEKMEMVVICSAATVAGVMVYIGLGKINCKNAIKISF